MTGRRPDASGSVVEDVNVVADFLARRDIGALTADELERASGVRKADLLILLGNSLLGVTEAAAAAFKAGFAEQFMIVGGIGHSTSYLIQSIGQNDAYRTISTTGRTEADMLLEVAVRAAGIDPGVVLLERQSTNCGNNATNARDVLLNRGYGASMPQTIVLMQDPTMQRRSHASFAQAWAELAERESLSWRPRFVSYAAFIPQVAVNGQGELTVVAPAAGLGSGQSAVWGIDRLLPLLLGEIPRLRDDEAGYGPKGKGFIPHVDIPSNVERSYSRMAVSFESYLRFR
jgi:uncharacterized SAM-binding protein YcdF (DUF218 family)